MQKLNGLFQSPVKKFFLAIFLLLSFTIPQLSSAATITLAWDAPTPSANVSGYKIYWGWGTSGKYTQSIDVGNVTTYTISNLDTGNGGTWYSAATAYGTIDGKKIESAYSNEVSIPFPAKPVTYKYTIIIAP